MLKGLTKKKKKKKNINKTKQKQNNIRQDLKQIASKNKP